MVKDNFIDSNNQKLPRLIIKDLETLKVLTDPLRLQIIELLAPKPQTVNQVAQQLGLSPSRLYYHFHLLESSGLIRVVETRMVSNMMEKIYWITADTFDVDKDLLNFTSDKGHENITRVVTSALDATREDVLRSLQARRIELEHGAKPNPRDMVIKKLKKRLRTETYQHFVDAFSALMQEFSDLPDEFSEEGEVSCYAVACFLYPSFGFCEEEGQDSGDDDHE
ncbi:MAG: helix-turn-helix domain-containing protein [Brevefilum sp.]|nr:helix-turn-helix domain-containing protein [Brevefilum sp.]